MSEGVPDQEERFRQMSQAYPTPEEIARGKARLAEAIGLEWTCHVCGETRPDAAISVYTRERPQFLDGLPLRENVRYCNDREWCRANVSRVYHYAPEPGGLLPYQSRAAAADALGKKKPPTGPGRLESARYWLGCQILRLADRLARGRRRR